MKEELQIALSQIIEKTLNAADKAGEFSDWLQILISPKYYLFQYGADLIK